MGGYPTTWAPRSARGRPRPPPPPIAVGGPLAGFPYPSLAIGGAGELPLPLAAMDVGQLVAAAEPAPWGRGTDTVVNPAIQGCRQVKAAAVTMVDDIWATRLAAHVRGPLAEPAHSPFRWGETPAGQACPL